MAAIKADCLSCGILKQVQDDRKAEIFGNQVDINLINSTYSTQTTNLFIQQIRSSLLCALYRLIKAPFFHFGGIAT
jgi:hypothetical protein